MATITKRGDYQYQAKIRRKGFPTQTKTFERKRDAQDWATIIESEMRRGVFVDRSGLERTTLGEALKRYQEEIASGHKSYTSLIARIKTWCAHPLASRTLASLKNTDFAHYANERLKKVKPATVRRDLMVIAAVFTTARDDWELPVEESILKPVLKRLTQDNARNRRITPEEKAALLHQAALYSEEAAPCILLAIETGMRRGEIAQLQWEEIDLEAGIIHLGAAKTKNGEDRIVPLSLKAVTILSSLSPNSSGRVFKDFSRPDSITQFFDRICKRANIKDLRFHDLRHEAASRIAPSVETATLAKIMGWKNIQMAMRYYNPTAKELVTAIRGVTKTSDSYSPSETFDSTCD